MASSWAHQTRAKFFASFPKYRVWLVIRGRGARSVLGPCGGKGLVLRPPQSIATQVARVEEEKEQNKSRQIKINWSEINDAWEM